MEVVQTPMYQFKTVTDEGVKILLISVELPLHKMISYLDMTGQFTPAIIEQVWDSIGSLAQHPDPELQLDYTADVVLLSFIKHYKGSTQTVCISSNKNHFEKYSDNMVTNKFFRETEPLCKYNLHAYIHSNNIFFGVSTKDTELSNWENLKTKYSTEELDIELI